MKNKKISNYEVLMPWLSPIIAALSYIFLSAVSGFFENGLTFSSNHSGLLLIVPIALPSIGIVIALVGLVRSPKYWKLLPLVGLVANFLVALIVLLIYDSSSSPWEF